MFSNLYDVAAQNIKRLKICLNKLFKRLDISQTAWDVLYHVYVTSRDTEISLFWLEEIHDVLESKLDQICMHLQSQPPNQNELVKPYKEQ